MPRVRLSGRQKAVLAVALGLLMWAPTGVSHEDHTAIVTGHSSFYNGEGYDPCLASIAGIMRSRVMWFNDQVLVERYAGKGTFIFATEYGAPDPRGYNYLYSEGVYYDFTDPNGAQWHVEEAWYSDTLDNDAQASTPNPGAVSPGKPITASVTVNPVKEENRYYVWFVELSANPIYDVYATNDPQNLHTYYNFLNLIDTCKFNRERLDELADDNDENPYHATEDHDLQSGRLGSQFGHPNGEKEHTHEKWIIDLWIGRRPTTMPFGEVSTDPSAWESSWATQYPEMQAEQTSDAANQTVPDGFEESLP